MTWPKDQIADAKRLAWDDSFSKMELLLAELKKVKWGDRDGLEPVGVADPAVLELLMDYMADPIKLR